MITLFSEVRYYSDAVKSTGVWLCKPERVVRRRYISMALHKHEAWGCAVLECRVLIKWLHPKWAWSDLLCIARESFIPGKLNKASHCNLLLAWVFSCASYEAFAYICVGEKQLSQPHPRTSMKASEWVPTTVTIWQCNNLWFIALPCSYCIVHK